LKVRFGIRFFVDSNIEIPDSECLAIIGTAADLGLYYKELTELNPKSSNVLTNGYF
jgi:hypothetical protein